MHQTASAAEPSSTREPHHDRNREPIQPPFRIDGLSIRLAESEDRNDHALMQSLWPESLSRSSQCGRDWPNTRASGRARPPTMASALRSRRRSVTGVRRSLMRCQAPSARARSTTRSTPKTSPVSRWAPGKARCSRPRSGARQGRCSLSAPSCSAAGFDAERRADHLASHVPVTNEPVYEGELVHDPLRREDRQHRPKLRLSQAFRN
jgi:hypothetical protein